MGRLIENLWDCKFCGTNGIGGSIRVCPNCGKPRDKDTRFYLPSQKVPVSEERARKINKNPDWLCEYCDSLNSADNTNCEYCGAARTLETLDYFANKRKQEAEKREKDIQRQRRLESENDDSYDYEPTRSISNHYSQSYPSSYSHSDSKSEPQSYLYSGESISKNAKWVFSGFDTYYLKLSLIVITVLALIGGLVYLLIPKKEVITITEFSWQRSIYIERLKTVNESDWELPIGARLQYERSEIFGYDNVIDHYVTKSKMIEKQRIVGYENYVSGYRDLGNGFSEEIISQRPIYETYYETEYYEEPVYVKVPIYRTKYYYEIDRWVHERTVTSKNFDQSPYWEEVTLNSNERVSTKTETYYIKGYNQKGKETKISIDYSEWKSLAIGDTKEFSVSIFGTGKLSEDKAVEIEAEEE